MSLRLYNSLTREKEPFAPETPGEVRMYVCGVTVYDVAHVGHARSALVFDAIRRYLVFRGYRVRFVRNFTDVDDKIIARAAQTGEPWQALTQRYIDEYQQGMAWLGVERPDEEPRATEHVPQMVDLIRRLIAAAVAYVVDGDVYFEVRRFPGYGRLSGRALDELLAGARVEVDERKRDPLDFALWKAAKPGEPAWESPWGPGRPGWHIECSAMSMHYLGSSLDVHGGGQDLVFPHHENEIAQSEAATGRSFARYWLHHGLVNFGADKMSKSLGNVLTVADLAARHPFARETLRLYLLGTHYRNPVDFQESRLEESWEAIWRAAMLIGRVSLQAGQAPESAHAAWDQLTTSTVDRLLARLAADPLGREVRARADRFTAAMDDDFNTPQALAALFELIAVLQRESELVERGRRATAPVLDAVAVLQVLGRVLGLLWAPINPFEFPGEIRRQMEPLIAEREAARTRRDWEEADRLRAALEERLGVTVEDTSQGPRPRWKRAPAGP